MGSSDDSNPYAPPGHDAEAPVAVATKLRKPVSVWIAQAWLGLGAVMSARSILRAYTVGQLVLALVFFVSYGAFVGLAQVRRRWAHWVFALGLVLSMLWTAGRSVLALSWADSTASAEVVGELIGLLICFVLFGLLGSHVILGERAKAYFRTGE